VQPAPNIATRNYQRLGYRRIVQLLVYLIIIPTGLLLFVGIILMFLGEARLNLVFGILTVSLVLVVVTGVVLALVFVRRQANLSELQADFVSKVSHELRTPLTAIRLFAETIERSRQDDATVDRCLHLLIEECERLTARIERLLDWGRMQAGRKLYELKEEKIDDVIAVAIQAFSPLRQGKVEVTTSIAPELPIVHVDRDALVDAIVNLLSNAYKYGGDPPIVKVRAGVADEDEIAITVTDNGGGIPRDEQRRIFDKFYRIDDRLSRAREGSGLGLAIVKHIVRAHRGRVELDSDIGKGSTFKIILPTGKRARAS
jgi:two-component system phosphate regulon sensor histidine kinase PhoR